MNSAPTPRARLFLIPLMDVLCFLIAVFALFTLSMNRVPFPPSVRPPAVETWSACRDGLSQATVVIERSGRCWLTDVRPPGGSDQMLTILANAAIPQAPMSITDLDRDPIVIEGTPAQLVTVLASFRSFEPDLRVTIAADERVSFSKMAPILNGLAREHITRVAFETRPAPTSL